MVFDETNFSGYFPNGSGTVAVTPIIFNPATGTIVDADILFNGSGFGFATDGTPSEEPGEANERREHETDRDATGLTVLRGDSLEHGARLGNHR